MFGRVLDCFGGARGCEEMEDDECMHVFCFLAAMLKYLEGVVGGGQMADDDWMQVDWTGTQPKPSAPGHVSACYI